MKGKEIKLMNSNQQDQETFKIQQDQTVLTPLEERRVDFYGDEITAALVSLPDSQNQVYIPIKPICDYLGLDSQAQVRRIRRDPVLSEYLKGIAIMATPSEGKRSTGGVQTVLALPLEMLPGWLFGIDANRVKPELKDKVIRYQRECFKALWRAFEAEVLGLTAKAEELAVSPDQEIDDYEAAEAALEQQLAERGPSASELALLQIREMGLSIARMAEQQLEIEREVQRAHNRLDLARDFVRTLQRRIGATEQRLGAAEGKLGEVEDRLETVEDRLSPPQGYITDDQAATIAAEVKAFAELLTENEAKSEVKATQGMENKKKPHNQYSAVFAELYRRFSISTYKLIRLSQYPAVLQFLADWKHAADNNISNEVFLQGKLF
jgi:hypothetical protein